MAELPDGNNGKIRVADVTLAQLSRGLYRSTATAFKELVSNAFDADAPEVRIDTNFPEFDFISCADNGHGMPLGQFLRYFEGEGIGSCSKRKGNTDATEMGRPVIGRLGIGMMAIGQLCHSFEIESHYEEGGKKDAYRATIVLADFDVPDIEATIRNEKEAKQVEVGKWSYVRIDYEEKKKGFAISSSDVRKTFTREMKESVKEVRTKMSFKLDEIHKQFYEGSLKSIRDRGAYLETIWELATLCPLPYYGKIDSHPINTAAFDAGDRDSDEFKRAIELIRQRQKRLLDHDFRVVFDGIELKRLVQLPTKPEVISRLYFMQFDGNVFGSPLKFAGYLFAQIGCAVRPPELNGVQIRLRDVGIGGYDSTYLRYAKEIETIRSRWVSGEIFVDTGLEPALNLDRDSFNEHDEHFKKLQRELHHKLGTVFNEIERVAASGREKRRDSEEKEVQDQLKRVLQKGSQGKYKLRQRELGRDEPVVVPDDERGEIIVNTSARPLRKKKARRILTAAMVAYHTASRTAKGDEQKREKAFYKLLMEILDNLV